ncbi:MAG TPA: hypothetical protein VFA99_05080 [Acidobacteriaceae bacterium]|nr:hypothetical protein [Acidobacteriaceae bacterium]
MALHPTITFPKRAAVFCAVLAATTLSIASGCGGGGGSSSTTPVQTTPTVTTNPAVTAKILYSVDSVDYTVDEYTANQSGAVTPTATISTGSQNLPTAIAGDASGNLYVSVNSNGTNSVGEILVFTGAATTPTRTITLAAPATGYMYQVSSMTTDSMNNLYVAASGAPLLTGLTGSFVAIFVYAPGATGTASPLRTISGAATTLKGGPGSSGMAQMSMDSKDNLYVANSGGSPGTAVLMFPAGASGNVAPTVITGPTYAPTGVALDAQDNIYISQSQSGPFGVIPSAVYVFAKGSGPSAMPTRTIMGTATGQNLYLNNIHVDSGGNIFVAQVADGHQAFLVYSATANGNVAPSSTLSPARGSTLDGQFYLK